MTSTPAAKGSEPPSEPSQAPSSAELLADLKHLYPREIDLSLGRIERLLASLGHPEADLPPVIHVAGTNGKGSVIAFIRAIFEAAGKKVHSFTSPHLVEFHERIQLAGQNGAEPISDGELTDVLQRAAKANDGQPITYFEIITAAAFLAFTSRPADVTLLETGLGGRLDATNVIARPLLTVITPISIDHTAYLGSSLAEIAGEKAGIMKPDVTCVLAPQDDEALRVIEARADELGTPLLVAGREWDAHEQHGRLIYQTADELIDLPIPRLQGRHQIDNAGCAITAARACLGAEATQHALHEGLLSTTWPARLERLGPGRLYENVHPQTEIWLDGGHNAAAAIALARSMAELEERVPRPLHLICGMMASKDALAFFDAFQGLSQWAGTVPIEGNANAFSARDLAGQARTMLIPAEAAQSVPEALATSRAIAGDQPVRVLIAGSLYLAGHVLKLHSGVAAES